MTESVWNGFKRLDFTFEGMEAILVFPSTPTGSHWMLKTEYFDAFPSFEIEMLKRGWYLAYVKNVTRWCLDEDLDRKNRFADFLSDAYGLNEACVPVGMSCGGLIACKFAAKYPWRVLTLYLDAPVMNLLSCPAALGKAKKSFMPEFVKATGLDLPQLICYRKHPIDQMHLLLENKIPIVMVYGDSDEIVPYEENGAILEAYYRNNGGNLLVIGKAKCGHHPHGLEDNTPIINFVEAIATQSP